ncbi:MAG: 3-phosphoshikimate 1-carboxyvinyltransferase [Erysipelothrix sp.]|nr:3-phosphoshikimate 1-carboxyvinyltransferase [Erysipelothrix sp.]
MQVKVFPSKVFGTIKVPASKSVVHRALIASALSNGYNEIDDVDFNEDIFATINGLEKLGAKILIKGSTICINGFDVNQNIDKVEIDANESGSTLRFLIPIATSVAQEVKFVGSQRLMERPLNVYKDLYLEQGLMFADNKCRKIIKGKLKPKTYQVQGNVSSQFISGLMFLLPLLKADSIIEVIKPFESKPYVYLTISILEKYGIKIKTSNNKFYIKGNQKYQPYNLKAEGDLSQAAFFAVLAAINNDLVLENINLDSVQGDLEIFNILQKLNVRVEFKANSVKVFKSKLKSASIDLANMPDLGPILCVLGLFSDDYLRLDNVRRLRIKESDRLLTMKNQLEKIGAKVILEENSITVYKLEDFIDKEIEVDGSNDHRIVMAMAVLATVLKKPLIINGALAVNKSYPNFFKDLNSIWVKTK